MRCRKEVFWIFTLLCVLPFIYADEILMDAGTSISMNGKNITFMGFNQEFANFKVDGVFGSVAKNETQNINGVIISLKVISKSPQKVIIDITVPFSCGDAVCSENEGYTICCKDCGCLSSTEACVNNQCVANITHPDVKSECYVASDCDDHKTCTVDTCNTQYIPSRCEHLEIITCQHNDGCCPSFCVEQGDSDCIAKDACSLDFECDDKNPCTRTACSGVPKRCISLETQEGCPLQDACVAVGTISNTTYCTSDHIFVPLKAEGDSCTTADECLTHICSLNMCSRSSLFERASRWVFYITLILAIILVVILSYLHLKKPRGLQPRPGQY